MWLLVQLSLSSLLDRKERRPQLGIRNNDLGLETYSRDKCSSFSREKKMKDCFEVPPIAMFLSFLEICSLLSSWSMGDRLHTSFEFDHIRSLLCGIEH